MSSANRDNFIGPVPICVYTKLIQSFSSLCDHMDHGLPGSSVHGISPGKNMKWVTMPSSGDLPDIGIEPASPELAVGFFNTEPLGKTSISW